MKHFIKFNGKSSLDLHLLLSGDIQHVVAQNDVEEVEVLGRDGSILVDKHRLKTVVQPYEFYLKLPAKVKMQNAIDAVSDWLSPVGYCELEKSWDKDYIYLASFNETFSVSETLFYLGKMAVNFKIHPIKYLKSGREFVEVQNNSELVNPTNRTSLPVLKIAGNGNVKITVSNTRGRQEMKLEDIERKVFVDCENEVAYSEDGNSMLSVYGADFIHLDIGTSRISWDNPSMKVWIQTNWGVKV